MSRLHLGDTFWHLDLHQVGGQSVEIFGTLADGFDIVLFNRGAWCPFCTSKLRAFQRAVPAFDEPGAKVVCLRR